MGVLDAMLNLLSSRRAARRAEQADVDRARALQREEMRRITSEFEHQFAGLRSAEARMLDALSGMAAEASRGKRERGR